MIILPFLFFSSIFLFFLSITKEFGRSFFISCVLWAFLLLFITELLSFFSVLTGFWAALCWALATLVVLFLQSFLGHGFLLNIKEWKRVFALGKGYKTVDILMLSIVFIIIGTVCLIAFIAPPNNWDSMTYHMTRVFFWLQHKNVDFYPTMNLRQLGSPPWSEYAITHYTLLWGGDRFANIVQFFAMLLSLFAVALIAKKLGAKRRAQVFSVFFCAAIPMAILQSSSTQNDYAAAFWFLSSIYFLLVYIKNPVYTNAALFALSVGLAVLTKGTNYIFLLPCLLCFAFFALKNRMFFKSLCVGSILFFAVNLSFYIRNYSVFNTPVLAMNTSIDFQDLSEPLSLFFLGPLKNIVLHLQPLFPYSFSIWIETILAYISKSLGMSLEHANFNDMSFKVSTSNPLHEDTAGNLIALLLIFAALFILFVFPQKLKSLYTKKLSGREAALSSLRFYSCLILSAFLLFSISLKWQPWHSRLHLPIFAAFAPLIGIAFSVFKKRTTIILGGLLFLSILPHLLLNTSRPLLKKPKYLPDFLENISLFAHHWPLYSIWEKDRKELYFTNRPKLAKEYVYTAQKAKQSECSRIALLSGGDTWEYPLVLFLKDLIPDLWVQHIRFPENLSKIAEGNSLFKDFNPCLLVLIEGDGPRKIEYKSEQFVRVSNKKYLDLYQKR